MKKKPSFLEMIELQNDGIWGNVLNFSDQEEEKILRKKIANSKYTDYLSEISKHHSIPVMDKENEKFISLIPKNGVILDVGGCWGWHWRRLHETRPDLTVVIIDLIRENLMHAQDILKNSIEKNKIYLVNGNALDLKFNSEIFDGVWSVQTTQHIPNYNRVFKEIFRVLKFNGHYWDYGLNNAAFIRIIYSFFKKHYHLLGSIEGSFFLRRVNNEVLIDLKNIFKNNLEIRFTELLFTPDLRIPLGGKHGSKIGWIDSMLGGSGYFRKLFARQCSFHIKKLFNNI